MVITVVFKQNYFGFSILVENKHARRVHLAYTAFCSPRSYHSQNFTRFYSFYSQKWRKIFKSSLHWSFFLTWMLLIPNLNIRYPKHNYCKIGEIVLFLVSTMFWSRVESDFEYLQQQHISAVFCFGISIAYFRLHIPNKFLALLSILTWILLYSY